MIDYQSNENVDRNSMLAFGFNLTKYSSSFTILGYASIRKYVYKNKLLKQLQ